MRYASRMIIVLVEIGLEAGSAERARDAIRTMEEATHKEEGCLTYAFSVDLTDNRRMRVTECWRSLDDVAAHMKTPHMAAFGAAIAEIKPTSVTIKAYEVAREVQLPR